MRTMTAKELRARRVRFKISGTQRIPRLSVARSHQNIFAQLIDDESGSTLLGMRLRASNITESAEAGKTFALASLKIGTQRAIFDRGSHRFHGRLKAFADHAEKNGLSFRKETK